MNRRRIGVAAVVGLLALLLGGEGLAHSDHPPEGGARPDPALQSEIARCARDLAQRPRAIPLRNRLTLLLIRQGQKSGEPAFFERAETLAAGTLEDVPGNRTALALHAWVALFRHHFREGAVRARTGLASYPEMSFFYGVLSDAALETGHMAEAVSNAEKMLDLRPDQGAYSRAAHLRSLLGDAEGARDLWRRAIAAGLPGTEDTAWCRVELGNEYLKSGALREAEGVFREALALRPGDRAALDALEKLRKASPRQAESPPAEARRFTGACEAGLACRAGQCSPRETFLDR